MSIPPRRTTGELKLARPWFITANFLFLLQKSPRSQMNLIPHQSPEIDGSPTSGGRPGISNVLEVLLDKGPGKQRLRSSGTEANNRPKPSGATSLLLVCGSSSRHVHILPIDEALDNPGAATGGPPIAVRLNTRSPMGLSKNDTQGKRPRGKFGGFPMIANCIRFDRSDAVPMASGSRGNRVHGFVQGRFVSPLTGRTLLIPWGPCSFQGVWAGGPGHQIRKFFSEKDPPDARLPHT